MLKRALEFFVIDTFLSIDRIYRFTQQAKSPDDIWKNELLFSGVIRELQVIGEAVNHLLTNAIGLDDATRSAWRDIVNFRNIVVHEYFGIDTELIYSIVKQGIPDFEQKLVEQSSVICNKQRLTIAIADARQDLESRGASDSIAFLNDLARKIT